MNPDIRAALERIANAQEHTEECMRGLMHYECCECDREQRQLDALAEAVDRALVTGIKVADDCRLREDWNDDPFYQAVQALAPRRHP